MPIASVSTATAVNAGRRASPRAAYRTSCSEGLDLFVKAHASLPEFGGMVELIANLLDARAESAQRLGARVGGRHAQCDELLDARRDERLELVVDVGVNGRVVARRQSKEPPHARTKIERLIGCSSSLDAFGGEHRGQRVEVVDEPLRLGAQMGAPRGREPVVARPASVLRHAPLGGDQLALLHAVERLEQRRVVDLSRPADRSSSQVVISNACIGVQDSVFRTSTSSVPFSSAIVRSPPRVYP